MSTKTSNADVEVGETTPLLNNAEVTTVSGLPSSVPLQDLKAESLKEKAVAGVALVSFVTSLLSMTLLTAAHPTVWISSLLGLIVAPTAAFQQYKLTQVEALQQTNVVFERETQKLSQENAKLQQTVQQMEESVLNLEAMEQTLQTLQAVEGQSVELLEQQVIESKQVLKQLQGNHAGRLLQNFLTVLFQVNHQDQDLLLDDDNIENLITRLEGLHDVNVNDELLRKVIIEQGRSIQAVMQIAKNIIQGGSGTAATANSATTGSAPPNTTTTATTTTTTTTDMASIFTFIEKDNSESDSDESAADVVINESNIVTNINVKAS